MIGADDLRHLHGWISQAGFDPVVQSLEANKDNLGHTRQW